MQVRLLAISKVLNTSLFPFEISEFKIGLFNRNTCSIFISYMTQSFLIKKGVAKLYARCIYL